MGRGLLIARPASLRALSVSFVCLISVSALAGCKREADLVGGKDAATTASSQAVQPATNAPSAPKRGSCHRVGPLACEEAPAASGPEFVKQLQTCLENYRELDHGRIKLVTGAERLDRGAGIPGSGVSEVTAFAVTAQIGANAELRTMRSVYLAAEYGDGLCLVDQLMLPRDLGLPCSERFYFRWQPASTGNSAPLGLIVETETTCSYARGASSRCASAEYRVSGGKFWITRESDRAGTCRS